MSKNNVPAKKEGTNLKDRVNNLRDYILGVYSELKKVHWPNRRQLMAYTGVVLAAVAIVAAIIWLFDSGVSLALEKLFKAFGA